MSIKWTKELLEECRNERGVVFGMMSKAAKNALASLDHQKGQRQYYNGNRWDIDINAVVSKCVALRVAPDWTPPELEEKPFVDEPVFTNHRNSYGFDRNGSDWDLSDAVDFCNFVGYVYADGMVSLSPRRFNFDSRISIAPVAVRFWKDGAK